MLPRIAVFGVIFGEANLPHVTHTVQLALSDSRSQAEPSAALWAQRADPAWCQGRFCCREALGRRSTASPATAPSDVFSRLTVPLPASAHQADTLWAQSSSFSTFPAAPPGGPRGLAPDISTALCSIRGLQGRKTVRIHWRPSVLAAPISQGPLDPASYTARALQPWPRRPSHPGQDLFPAHAQLPPLHPPRRVFVKIKWKSLEVACWKDSQDFRESSC